MVFALNFVEDPCLAGKKSCRRSGDHLSDQSLAQRLVHLGHMLVGYDADGVASPESQRATISEVFQVCLCHETCK